MAWSAGAGYFACFICTIFYGSMFVPLKRVHTGDGMFVQFIMGCAILCTGLTVGIYNSFADFYPLAMLGGFLWATGNITAIPIINRIGMTIGMLLWSFFGLLSGWASGRFGWFGIKAQKPEDPLLNYFGLLLSLLSTVMFALVKSEPMSKQETGQTDEHDELLDNESDSRDNCDSSGDQPLVRSSLFYRQKQRILAIVAAIVAGLLYGLCFIPVIYIQDNVEKAPKESLDYVFSFTCGVFVTSTAYFLIYAVYKHSQPVIDPNVVLPAFLAGVLWAVAQTSFFVAIEALSEAVSFPIISRFPGLIAALWGVLLFDEIRGKKNLIMLTAAMIVTIIGGILSGLSRVL